MNEAASERARQLGLYIIETKATVRAAAKEFGVSKSTVHTDVSKKLEKIDFELYELVRRVLDENKSQRHIRGGIATREKYKTLREAKLKNSAKS
ncbi:MAG: sporulation transcriptional regulator SpoIIID [Acutalibacteraceae bacterium]